MNGKIVGGDYEKIFLMGILSRRLKNMLSRFYSKLFFCNISRKTNSLITKDFATIFLLTFEILVACAQNKAHKLRRKLWWLEKSCWSEWIWVCKVMTDHFRMCVFFSIPKYINIDLSFFSINKNFHDFSDLLTNFFLDFSLCSPFNQRYNFS